MMISPTITNIEEGRRRRELERMKTELPQITGSYNHPHSRIKLGPLEVEVYTEWGRDPLTGQGCIIISGVDLYNGIFKAFKDQKISERLYHHGIKAIVNQLAAEEMILDFHDAPDFRE